jgi:hypothetical protein
MVRIEKRHHFAVMVILCLVMGLFRCISPTVAQTGTVGIGYIITTSSGVPAQMPDPAIEYKNLYGICWNGTNSDNLRYAKNMGYKYIEYNFAMEDDPNSADMNFFVESPRYSITWSLFNDYCIHPNRKYENWERKNIERYYAWKSGEAFPNNIATGWLGTEKEFAPQPDFQQQAVIDYFVDAVVKFIKSKERPSKKFLFAGVTWDVALLTGDFWSGHITKGGRQVTLAYWTGSDSALLHDGITHEYATYSDGMAAYLKALMQRLRREFPDRQVRFMMEPYNLYLDWIKDVEKRADKLELMPDLLYQENGWELGFVEDGRIFASGLISRDRVGSTTPDRHDEPSNRLIAAKAAINGSWFNWFGRFGGSGDMIGYNNIYEVPAWLQLIRVAANWDNLAGVPLGERSWIPPVYQSPNSYMDGHVIATRNPYNGKLYVVFFDRLGQITLRPGESVAAISRADACFAENGDARSDLAVSGNTIRLK